MLILTVDVGGRVLIETPGGPVWVSLLEVRKNRARIGIEAPRDYLVLRESLIERGNEKEEGR